MSAKLEEKEITVINLHLQEELDLAEKLLRETGELSDVKFTGDRVKAPTFFIERPGLTPAMAIREMIRSAGLRKYGFSGTPNCKKDGAIGKNRDGQIIFEGDPKDSLDSEHVKALLLEPINFHYKWQDVFYWNLGAFETIDTNEQGSIWLIGLGIFLFSDEVLKLRSGEVVTPIYLGGFNGCGFLDNQLDTYQVRNKNLFRVYARLTD